MSFAFKLTDLLADIFEACERPPECDTLMGRKPIRHAG